MELLSPREVAAASDIVILCVTGSPEVEAVCFGSNGIIESARRGLVVIDTSTAEPTSTAALRDRFAQHGVEFVDAPLARTPVEAEAGQAQHHGWCHRCGVRTDRTGAQGLLRKHLSRGSAGGWTR